MDIVVRSGIWIKRNVYTMGEVGDSIRSLKHLNVQSIENLNAAFKRVRIQAQCSVILLLNRNSDENSCIRSLKVLKAWSMELIN